MQIVKSYALNIILQSLVTAVVNYMNYSKLSDHYNLKCTAEATLLKRNDAEPPTTWDLTKH